MSKLASPSGFPKAHFPLTRVGQASVKRQALHVIRLYEPRTELRCPLKASVPLAVPSIVNRCYVNYEDYCARVHDGPSAKSLKSDTFAQWKRYLSTIFFLLTSLINE